MQRRAIEIDGGKTLAYGHYGRPVIAFPSEDGAGATTGRTAAWSTRSAPLLEAGRLKLYCVPRTTRESWTRRRPSARGARPAPRHYE